MSSVLFIVCRPYNTLRTSLRVLPLKTYPVVQHRSYFPQKVDTSVVKDIILFRNNNVKYLRLIAGFGICQFTFWSILSYNILTSMKDAPVAPVSEASDKPWWRKVNLGQKKYKYALGIGALGIGFVIFYSSVTYTMRNILSLVLNKGGKTITFTTFGIFGEGRQKTVSLNKVSCVHSRHSSRVQIPLKIQGQFLYYVVDMRGEFLNATLFDRTAGIKRNF